VLQTVCLEEADAFALPKGRVVPRGGVRIPQSELLSLRRFRGVQIEVEPVAFPDYATALLSQADTLGLLNRAAVSLARRYDGPDTPGRDPSRAAAGDIFDAALAVEERHPGIIFERQSRPPHELQEWFWFLGTNVRRRDLRRYRRQEEPGGVVILPLTEGTRPSMRGGDLLCTCSAEDVVLQAEEGWDLAQTLRVLPAATQEVLDVVAWEGLGAALKRYPRQQVAGALQDARALLQARELLARGLGQLAPGTQHYISVVAQYGLSQAAATLGVDRFSPLVALRDGLWMMRARELQELQAVRCITLPAEIQHMVDQVAAQGRIQTARAQGLRPQNVSEVLDEATALLRRWTS